MTLAEFQNRLSKDKALKKQLLKAIIAGGEKDFLAQQGVELLQTRELSDDELDSVAGGVGSDSSSNVYKRDSRGNATHWIVYNSIVYYTCPKCGRLMHGNGDGNGIYYCDPCDDWFTYSYGSAVRHTMPYNG